jgi:hypothetical protein
MGRQVDGQKSDKGFLNAMVIVANNADKMKESFTSIILFPDD